MLGRTLFVLFLVWYYIVMLLYVSSMNWEKAAFVILGNTLGNCTALY